jgi:hypothetical protein
MHDDRKLWKLMAGTLAILVAVALALQSQMTGLDPARVFSCLVLGGVGIWLLTRANRETPS